MRIKGLCRFLGNPCREQERDGAPLVPPIREDDSPGRGLGIVGNSVLPGSGDPTTRCHHFQNYRGAGLNCGKRDTDTGRRDTNTKGRSDEQDSSESDTVCGGPWIHQPVGTSFPLGRRESRPVNNRLDTKSRRMDGRALRPLGIPHLTASLPEGDDKGASAVRGEKHWRTGVSYADG